MLHRLFTLISAISLLLCLGATVLWFRTRGTTDVWMVPTGRQSAILFNSHETISPTGGGWGELVFVSRWPGPRLGWWSGHGWRNIGPLLVFARVPGHEKDRYAPLWTRAGTVMVPRVAAGGSVAYEHSYDRAEALGFPRTMAWPPETAIAVARQLYVPFGRLILIAALPPIVWISARLRNTGMFSRRRHRMKNQLCVSCGYDVRATPARCPECGTPVPQVGADSVQ